MTDLDKKMESEKEVDLEIQESDNEHYILVESDSEEDFVPDIVSESGSSFTKTGSKIDDKQLCSSNEDSDGLVDLSNLVTEYKSEKEDEKINSELMPLPSDSVKSVAIVKYSAAEAPALYTRLRCNTNLNLPPSNWLSNSTETYGLQPSLLHRSGFSSFRIAHMFPDCIGQVDVVSDAENIKKLLKIPYSRGSVSMMIHRIENTLLIDEFDIHKYLLREAENQWEWFKKFFFEHIMQPVSKKDIPLHHKDNSRNALQRKSLASKFLYHSLVVADNMKKDGNAPQTADPSIPIPLPYKKINPSLPEPKLEEEVPDPTSNHKFSRNVVWTFEDIQMLLGTDMPIFGGGTHPCISLRLRDMTKPINVLTGMDYWLDNLMCNVPEVVMCYHLNGIVQKYELIKTEDLPHLENSKFSPKVIRDIAQNILSFLKSNATKAGHTYWLFKGKDDDVVKLYDLTSLCTDVMDEKGQTPFTVPVAMLLYRVARNMKNSPDGRRQAATIRMLLQNCIALLTPEKYAGIVTSAHYMMADLYIPAEVNPKSPELVIDEEECNSKQEVNEQSEEGDAKRDDWGVKSLSLSNIGEVQLDEAEYIPPSPPPIGNDIESRCFDGIKHVVEGLRCLKFLAEIEGKDQKQQEKGDEPEMAKPSQSIPMPYQSLNAANQDSKKKTKRKKGKQTEEEKSLLCKPRFDAVASWHNPNPKSFMWNVHLKTLLYEKAYLIYATLVEKSYADAKYGLWLHYIRMVLKIRKILKTIRPDLYCDEVESYFVGPAGDAFFMIVQNSSSMEMHNKDYLNESDFDRDIQMELDSLGIGEPDENDSLFPSSLASIEELLLCSYKCYKRAMVSHLEQSEHKNLQRHLGNIVNELGVFYMNQAAEKYQEIESEDEVKCSLFKDYCAKSQAYLEEGIRAFDSVKDKANLALLHSNIGRLMRLKAHFHGPVNDDEDESKKEVAGQERFYYGKAIASYQKALQVLGERKYNPVVWDSVNWELSTALYSMASFLQDYPTCFKTQEEAMREVTETLHKALKYCDSETPGPRQPVYQFRSAMIHHRLASLYHKSYRTNSEDESRRKKVIQLCKLHYEKSANLFLFLEHPAEYLRVQLERVALLEFQAESVTSANSKIKHLENGLELLLESKIAFKMIMEGENKSNETEESKELEKEKSVRSMALEDHDKNEIENELNLLGFFEQRLQFILLSLTKLTLSKVDGKKESNPVGEMYKKLYATTLKKDVKERNPVEQAKWFYNLASDISKTLKK